jgi:hypothetical protein
MRAKDLSVHVIHRFEVTHVFQKHSAPHDFVQVGSRGLKDRGNILKGTFGLLVCITLDDLPGNGIESKLSAHENESTAPDSL